MDSARKPARHARPPAAPRTGHAPGGWPAVERAILVLAAAAGLTPALTERLLELARGLSNFLPECGVAPGRNELVFQLEQAGDAQVLEAHVYVDTSIEVSGVGPPDLEIMPVMPSQKPGPDEPFEVGYFLTNSGREARGVTISLLAVTGRRAETLDSDYYPSVISSVDGTFHTPGMSKGKHRLILGASAEVGDRPVVDISVVIGDDENGILALAASRWSFALASLLLAAGLVTAVLLRVRTGS